MRELKLKYDDKNCQAAEIIRRGMANFEFSWRCATGDQYVKQKYDKTVSEMWEILFLNEKQEAEAWVKEYEEKLIQEIQDYENGVIFLMHNIEMDY